jgi:protocatechuate 3,4-dioxygenase beta subunit
MDDHQHDEPHDHDGGLATDLPRLLSRRRALQVMGLGSLAVLAGCAGATSLSGTGESSPAATSTGAEASGGSSDVAEVPEETAGPFPGDGSNGINVLTESGIVRSDITASFGGASGVAEGVPLTIDLTVLDVAAGGTPREGAAVYIWHCDREGRYSLYSDEVLDENYLRGLQPADGNGKLVFTSIFPGAYAGRWPHIHFEVYPSVDEATAAGSKLVTSQIALPEDVCQLVYATAGYEPSVQNLAQTSLTSDMVFSDGYSTQLATTTGSVGEGITIALNVGV